MNNIHRPLHIALASLLAFGGLAAATQAGAQEAPVPNIPGAQPAGHLIDRFMVAPGTVVQPGREVRYVLLGQPYGRAWVDIPGVRSGVPLVEVRPGVYEGGYLVQRGDNLDSVARAFGGLQAGNATTTTQLPGTGVTIVQTPWVAPGRPPTPPPVRPPNAGDRQPPQIVGMTPSQGERVNDRGRTRIAARVVDNGAGIDRGSLVLRVDGRDVTRRARFDGSEVEYSDDLDRGRHTAEVVVRDRAGNTSRASWTFEVEGRRWGRDERDERDRRDNRR